MKKVQKHYEQEFYETIENSIVNSVLPPYNATYEGIEFSENQPIPEEEDYWFTEYLNNNKRRSK